MLIIGADPGQQGAIAILTWRGDLVAVIDTPFIRDGKVAFVDGIALHETFHEHIGISKCHAIVERVSAMPKQGVASTFSFGLGFGSLLGTLRSMGCAIELVTAAQWKREMGLSSDKKASLDKARLLYPQAELHLAKHEGRAEAILLARWGVNRFREAGAP